MSEIKVNQISPTSPAGVINFTGATAPTYNGLPFAGGGGGGGGGGPVSGWEDPRDILSTPPTLTALTATGGFKVVTLSWTIPVNYINHAYTEITRSSTNNRLAGSVIGTVVSNAYTDGLVVPGTTYYYWVRNFNIEGAAGAYNAADNAGVSATIQMIGNTDLSGAIIEAGNLASGAVTAAKLANNAIDSIAKFASGMEPISIVASLPSVGGYAGPKLVFLSSDSKLYRYTGSAWVKEIATSDLSGTIGDGQLASGINANKLTGTLDVARIAANALDATKFATSIQPVTIVASVPGTKSTEMIFNTTDRKMYRWNGTIYTSAVAAADVSTGLTSAQIADLDAAKLTGTLNVSRIAANALDATKFATSIQPVSLVASVPGTKSTELIFNTTDKKMYRWNGTVYIATIPASDITGTISTTAIADGSIAGTKFASGIEPIATVASLPSVKSTSVIFNTFDQKLYRWNGTAYISSIPAADIIGSVSSVDIADGSIAATKFASSIQPIGIVSSVPGAKTTDMVFNTTNLKLYRWNGTAYIASIAAADITVGQITGTQITDGAITTAKMTAGTINANVLASGTITTNLMTADSINGDRITSNTLAAGKIVAGSITATQIAGTSITGDKIAGLTITGDKIQGNSITSSHIAANTINGDRIQVNTLDAGRIVSGSITATQLHADAVTATKIAAGAVTTAKMTADTIDGSVITTGTLAANKIAANSITAGQIATGAITTDELAAGSVTASKIVLVGRGAALNADPSCGDITAWTTYSGAPIIATITDGAVGRTSLRSQTGFGAAFYSAEKIPVDANKVFRLKGVVRASSTPAANGLFYLGICLFDANDVIIPGSGTFWWYMTAGITPSTAWTTYAGTFGLGTAKPFHANAKSMAVVVLLNNGPTTGYHEIQDVRIEEVIPASLIVDGTITTSKLSAGNIDGAVISANSLNASKIVAGSITTDRFTTNTIGGSILADGSITADKILANSITAGQIATGAITADEIAANTISASKMILSNRDSAFPDPGWHDRNWWTNGTTVTPNIYKEYSGTWPMPHMLHFQGPTGSFNFSTRNFIVELEATYRAKVTILMTPDFVGEIAIHQVYPGIISHALGIPRSGVSTVNGLSNIATSVTRDVWLTYTTQFTNYNYVVNSGDPNTNSRFSFAGNITAGNFYFAVELVRASSADLIVDGAITANKIQANSINSTHIQSESISADRLVANSITAGQIATGAITADEVAAGAITTAKLLVVPESLCPDPSFRDLVWWSATEYTSTGWYFETSAAANNAEVLGVPRCVTLWSGHATNIPGSAIKRLWSGKTSCSGSGQTLRLRAKVRNVSNQSIFVSARILNNAEVEVGNLLLTSAANSGVQTLNGQLLMPAGAAYVKFVIYNNGGTTYTGTSSVGDIKLDIAASADLIVDGAITATKLAANSIVAGTAVIQDGAIVNAMIANATIDNAKIASLSATKITTGTLDAARIAASSITADKINTTGLTIKNASGTTILDASGAGVMNWNILAGQPAGIYNSNVTITETGGNITLSGAGGGTVTAITPNNKISSGNVSTYMNSAAIGLAYINTATIANLAALSAEMGNVTISTTGSIKSGQSAYNVGSGWWLGIDAGIPKFSIGDPTGAYMRWNGSTLEIKNATITTPVIVPFTAAAPDIIAVLSNTTPTTPLDYGGTLVQVIGGTAPFTYSWTFVSYAPYPFYIQMVTPSTDPDIYFKGHGINIVVEGQAVCTVTDATGRVTSAMVNISATHGTPL